jgi:hypothetical protein
MHVTSLSQILVAVVAISFFIATSVFILFLITRSPIKLFEQTNEKLIFQIRIVFNRITSSFFAGFLIIPGLLIIFATSTFPFITTLDCHHYTLDSSNLKNNISVACDLKTTNWLLQNKQTILSDLHQAIISNFQSIYDDRLKVDLYELLLVTPNQRVSFNSLQHGVKNIRDYTRLQEVESKVNYYLENFSEKYLKIKYYDTRIGFVGFGFGIFLCILSIPVITIVPFGTYTFDRENNCVTLSNYKWFRSQVVKHPLDDIVDVEVEKADGEDGNVYLFNLVLKSGDKLPLNPCYTSFTDQQIQTVVNSIRIILNHR